MRAKEGTFRDLMTQDRQFQVPLYQRHYRWKTGQQQVLWQDILDQYRALADSPGRPKHFIGSIVAVEKDPDPLHDFREFRIVDGQQRLTTLSLALAALRDVSAQDDSNQFDRLNKKYLVNDTEPQGSPRWSRLVPGDEDGKAYWRVLTSPQNLGGNSAIVNAYRFFHRRISEVRDGGELHPERLATTIGDRLALVFVTVSEGERPHKIFESINATGVGLTESDLLRNYLFMALGERSNSVYSQYWRPFEKRLGPEGLESFIRDDLQSQHGFVKQNSVYRTARRQLEDSSSSPDFLDLLEHHVQRLARRSEYYALLLQPSDPENTAKALGFTKGALRHLTFLRGWGATTTYPLLLHIYDQVDDGSATPKQAESCLEAIESFIVRRYLAGVPTHALNRLFTGAIGNLQLGEPVDIGLRRELSRDNHWPDDAKVRDGIAEVDYYLKGRPHQQRLVLQRLESYLRAEVDLDFDSAELSIEHILPQSLNDGWKKELVDAGYDPCVAFDRYGHTLGNLTLTAWNSKLSNQLFERKKEILHDSDLKLNEQLAAAPQWGVEEIKERSTRLADAATALWTAPVPGVVTPRAGFDWSRVDDAVAALPPGSWTSYGDLADLAGTAAQPTANHIAHDSSVTNAYRVLSSDGTISFKFQWHDPDDDRDPLELLIGEGIDFDEDDKASQAQRLRPSDLEDLLDEAVDEL